MTTHTAFSPSTLDRREKCPGSYRMERDLPDNENEAAKIGTMLHDIVAKYANRTNPDTSALDPGQLEAVNTCFGFVDKLRRDEEGAKFLVEHKLDCSAISPEIGHGTTDLIVVYPFNRAIVVDWKFGFVDPEPAESNRQLAAYACAVAQEFECDLVQAYAVMVRKGKQSNATWTDFAYISQFLNGIVKAAKSPFAPCIPGECCRYCKANTHCPPLLEQMELLRVDQDVAGLPPSEVGRLLNAWKKTECTGKSLENLAYKILTAGGTVPGWELVEGRARRIWADDVTGAKLQELAVTLEKPEAAIWQTELSSPAQIEKAWGKAAKVRDALAPLITSKPGELKLAATKENK